MRSQKQKAAKKNVQKRTVKGQGSAVVCSARRSGRVNMDAKSAVRRSGKGRAMAKKVGRAAKQSFLPTIRNGGHPHLLRYYGFAVVFVLVFLVQGIYGWFIDGQVLGEQAQITQSKLVTATNVERERAGFLGLVVSPALTAAAEAKAADMFEKDYWSHDAPDGTRPWFFMQEAGYRYDEAGENLARGFNSAEGIVKAWLDSASHKANMLKADYTEVGFAVMNGVLTGKKTTLVVAMYGKPMTVGAVAGTEVAKDTQDGVVEDGEGLWVRLRRGMQSLMPSLAFVLVMLGIVMMVSVLAHFYRKQLPDGLKRSLNKHRVVYECVVLFIIGVGAVLSYGGGMI